MVVLNLGFYVGGLSLRRIFYIKFSPTPSCYVSDKNKISINLNHYKGCVR